MRSSIKPVLMGLALFSGHVNAQDSDLVVKKPLVITAKIEMGRIAHGDTTMSLGTTGQFLSFSSVGLMQEITSGERLDMKIGLGGTVFYSFPFATGAPAGNGAKFAPYINQAQAIYKLGNLDNPWATLRAG